MLTRRLDSNHDMTFGQGLANYAKDQEAVAQNVKTRLLSIMGEWFLDDGFGVPYLSDICINPANIPLAESLIRQSILGTMGVKEITSFDLLFSHETRKLSIAVNLTTVYGTIENIKVDNVV